MFQDQNRLGAAMSASQDERDFLAPSAASFADTVADGSVSLADSQHASQFDMRGAHYLKNMQSSGGMDNKLDRDTLDHDLVIENITQMIDAKLPIVQFMDSQEIVDAELLKDPTQDQIAGLQLEAVTGGLAEELKGTLYCRLSPNPALFHDKVERTKFFSSSRWQSISQLSGCWICNAKKIIERSKRP